MPYICAVPTTSAGTTEAPQTRVCANDTCYFVQANSRTLSQAEAVCDAGGGHVALPRDSTVMALLDDAFSAWGFNSYWLGMYATSGCSWTALDDGSTSYESW